MNESSKVNDSGQTGFIGLALRLLWMGFGNLALMVLAILIWQDKIPFFSVHDLLVGLVVVLLIVCRYIDISYFHGGTSYGEPATMKHWRRYVVWLVLISLAMWAAAHGLAYLP